MERYIAVFFEATAVGTMDAQTCEVGLSELNHVARNGLVTLSNSIGLIETYQNDCSWASSTWSGNLGRDETEVEWWVMGVSARGDAK